MAGLFIAIVLWFVCLQVEGGPVFSVQPSGNTGFDILADGKVIAPIRLAAGDAIQAATVTPSSTGILLSGLHTKDPSAVTFAADDFVSITLPTNNASGSTTEWQPFIKFKLTITAFDTNRWLALFPDGAAPFHFLVCSMPAAQVWHQRGWLNPTPYSDPFTLLQDVHTGSPEVSCLWNRNWSYLCPLGGHPIPMIGLWDPAAELYIGYDFQSSRSSDQSERYVSTGYCWSQAGLTNFVALAYPYGATRYGQQAYPQGGEVLSSQFMLEIETALPSTEDPNERFQQRLFARYTNSLPPVPAMNDLSWIPGQSRLADFAGPIGLSLYGPGGETTFYPAGTVLMQSWQGHQEMPIDTAVRRGDMTTLNNARVRIETLLTNYATNFTIAGDACLYWQKPLSGAWANAWGGAPVTTVHNSDGWYPARVLVELYRYDRKLGQVRTNYLPAIDGLFNWARHFVWSRNEFADVPSSPFAIGSTLAATFLLDYYFTFRNDPLRATNATLALHMADTITWRYLHPWAMDSDRFDGALDGAFLAEPNSGRDWAGLACANEVNWNIDSLTQVYVHTGDERMRYYLRGMLQRWPVLYQPVYQDSIAAYTSSEALTEGLGLFDGSGPGRGNRYPYGFSPSLPLNEPVGASLMRVVAGAGACIAFDKSGTASDVADYRTGGDGSCTFKIVSTLAGTFDVSFSYPFVDLSSLQVTRTRNGQTQVLGNTSVARPIQSPSSLYFSQLQNGDIITIGVVPANAPTLLCDNSLVYNETNSQAISNYPFSTVPLPAEFLLPQSWTDLNSFAGIVPGPHWNYGVPYAQTLHAVTNKTAVTAPGATVAVVAYSAPSDQETLTRLPGIVLDEGTSVSVSGHPVLAWRAWPIIFSRKVLLDYAVLPAGRTIAQVDPNGTLIMGVTLFEGNRADWQPIQDTLLAASATFVQQVTQELRLQELKQSYSLLPAGKIALLPLATAGPGANFAAATGLRNKWNVLTESQLIDTNQFNPQRYPLAFYLGGENYVKTVATIGDGKAAITSYLAGGGTLVILASGPFPFYYGYGPADQPGPADPLLPALGMPIQGFEQAPPGIFMQRYTNQTKLYSVRDQFDFPPGDPRLRAVVGPSISSANRYEPLLSAKDPQGTYYGDPAVFLAFRTGAAKGGKVLYVWTTLLSGPQGNDIMADLVSWVVNAALRPPLPRINAALAPGAASIVLQIDATSNLDYQVQTGSAASMGSWSTLADLGSASTNRLLRFTNPIGGTPAKFYRVKVGP
ncbi:MAG TPA: hypothetical protein VL793_09530 [Patescibacteria group bacterium]|nr:hypothetical protein [Patescibacteria group bacterium]